MQVDFTNVVVNGTAAVDGATVADESTITNNGTAKTADLVTSGTQAFSSTDGLTFANTTALSTSSYITGNLGSTTGLSKIEILITAKFPDAGCAAQAGGSMLFGLGAQGNYSQYNIYRHSNFIGYNTFNSDIYGISLPDNSSFHDYKFVMAANTLGIESSEIWVDGVKQTLSYKNTTVATAVAPCSKITGVGENLEKRQLATDTYNNGDFMLMSHPLNASQWGTTGTLKNVTINTIVITEDEVVEEPEAEVTDEPALADTGSSAESQGMIAAALVASGLVLLTVRRRIVKRSER